MDVFFFEAFEEEAAALKKYLGEDIVAGFTWKTIQEYGAELPPAKLISVRTQSYLPEKWADKLEGVLSRSTGYDHLKAYKEKTQSKIGCGFLPIYCNRAVAEHALMMWMNLQRQFAQQVNNFESFLRDGITGWEIEKKKLLVVGVGNIGYEIVKIGKGLNMKVSCVDLKVKFPDEQYVQIEEGVRNADIIVCSMNLNNSNMNYFNYDLLKKSKKGCLFINISRGEMSPSCDLLRLLEENHLGGVGLDVFDAEKELAAVLRDKQNSDNSSVDAIIKMKEMSNVILTPHNAFNTVESVERKSIQSVEQINYFLREKRFIWSVPNINI
ncbi:MAG: NAD(P)-dependent oxidoreductase [Bacteroidales bacterium]